MTTSPPLPRSAAVDAALPLLLKQLKLARFRSHWQPLAEQAEAHGWSPGQFLYALCELEVEQRQIPRQQRLLRGAHLPWQRGLDGFDQQHLEPRHWQELQGLARQTTWLLQAENLLLFGPSGVGKTHLANAITMAMAAQDQTCRLFPATALVQLLQKAKAAYDLPAMRQKLYRYALPVIDDISYVRRRELETSVLFGLICHRYERKSLLVTSNQPFREWDDIFPSGSMNVAAVDRLVHHCHIMGIKGESYRQKAATARVSKDPGDPPTSLARATRWARSQAPPAQPSRTKTATRKPVHPPRQSAHTANWFDAPRQVRSRSLLRLRPAAAEAAKTQQLTGQPD